MITLYKENISNNEAKKEKIRTEYNNLIIDLVNKKDFTHIFEHLRRNVKLSDHDYTHKMGRTNVLSYLRNKLDEDEYYATLIKYNGIDWDMQRKDIGTTLWKNDYYKVGSYETKCNDTNKITVGLYHDYDCEFFDIELDDYGSISMIDIWNDRYVLYENV